MKSDEELLKTFKIDRLENNLLRIEISQAEPVEEDNVRQAELLVAAIVRVEDENPKAIYSFLIDLTKVPTSKSFISHHAHEIYSKFNNHQLLNKAAIVGNSMLLEMAINLIMQAIGRGQSMRWFKDMEEAKKWLAESP